AKASSRGVSGIRRPPTIVIKRNDAVLFWGGRCRPLITMSRVGLREPLTKNPLPQVGEGFFSGMTIPRGSSVHQPVELCGVLAGDLVHHIGGQSGELLVDIFL